MSAFPQPFSGIAAPLGPDRLIDNIDTDAIIPSREMRSTGRTGLSEGLFASWRYLDAETRKENPDFVLNMPKYREATILMAGANFGCGSSREHAVWALAEWGIRVVLAESLAPIFKGNCIRNFILPISLPRDALAELAGQVLTVDLGAQLVSCGSQSCDFAIDPEAKRMLAGGLDAIDLTLTQSAEISTWISADRMERPWVYLENAK